MARLGSLLALALLASAVCAVPVSKRPAAEHGRLNFAPAVESVHVRNVGEQVSFLTPGASSLAPVDPLELGKTFAASVLDESAALYRDFVVTDSYTTAHNGVTHVYLRQVVDGIPVVNSNMNINVGSSGAIISYGSSFYTGAAAAPSAAAFTGKTAGRASSFFSAAPLTALEALNSFAAFIGRTTTAFAADAEPISVKPDGTGAVIENVPFAVSPVQSKVVYVQENGRLKLGWELTVEMEDSWYSTVVDAVSGDVVSVNDWVSDSAYNVYPFGVNDPEDGSRSVVTNPEDLRASPHGWHDQGTKAAPKKFTTTKGNNVWAQENLSGSTLYWEGNARPDGGDDLGFSFPLSLYSEPATYLDASIVQLFYTNNKIHDLFYLYGFDEVSGNFQDNNYAKGGLGGDGVIANAQDGSGKSNANFATPPDGQRGKMRMYTWTPSVERDGDLEAGIVIHEYAHGISNRLTGGPANSNCLGTGEAGGMGEGWGDFFATLIRQKSPSRAKPFPMGAYSARNANGIRKYPYSPDFTVNPETYSYIRKSGYEGVHAKGEVWANILYEAFLNLADDFGFDKDLSNPESSAGNVVILQNVVDGMKLQPCLPTFVDARDAILLADVINYGGKHLCQLWAAFAKRGLGEDAKAGGYDGFKLPSICEVADP